MFNWINRETRVILGGARVAARFLIFIRSHIQEKNPGPSDEAQEILEKQMRLDELIEAARKLERPDGTKEHPAKTCQDLHLDHPKLPNGELSTLKRELTLMLSTNQARMFAAPRRFRPQRIAQTFSAVFIFQLCIGSIPTRALNWTPSRFIAILPPTSPAWCPRTQR